MTSPYLDRPRRELHDAISEYVEKARRAAYLTRSANKASGAPELELELYRRRAIVSDLLKPNKAWSA